jgi:hypothetical protein
MKANRLIDRLAKLGYQVELKPMQQAA